jgi:predicted Zn-dependent protease
VRRPLSLDDVDELCARARTPEEHRRVAAQLAAWAEEVRSGDDDVSPASLLANAGEQLSRIGDHDAALEMLHRAVGAEGQVPPDVRCYLHHGLLDVGDVAGARRLADELRRERPADSDVYLFIGEDYELSGDLGEAHRWLTMGLLRMLARAGDDEDDLAVRGAAVLVRARYRVRRALDLPVDEYDELVGRSRPTG